MGKQGASEHLAAFLDKIKEIEKDSQFIPEQYENFKKRTYLEDDLNSFTRSWINDQLKLQQSKRLKQTKTIQQHTHYQQFETFDGPVQCNEDFADCQQYENHIKKVKGNCCCKCIAKKCLYDHLGLVDGNQKRNPHAAQRRATKQAAENYKRKA